MVESDPTSWNNNTTCNLLSAYCVPGKVLSDTHTNLTETEDDDGDKDKTLGDVNWVTALVHVVC